MCLRRAEASGAKGSVCPRSSQNGSGVCPLLPIPTAVSRVPAGQLHLAGCVALTQDNADGTVGGRSLYPVPPWLL